MASRARLQSRQRGAAVPALELWGSVPLDCTPGRCELEGARAAPTCFFPVVGQRGRRRRWRYAQLRAASAASG